LVLSQEDISTLCQPRVILCIVLFYAVIDDSLSPTFPLGRRARGLHPPRGRRTLHRGGRGDEPELAEDLRIEERELEAGGRN
jgi:hypothetical protein